MNKTPQRAAIGGLGFSVFWGYLSAFLLLAFLLIFLVPDVDGPSPLDWEAVQEALLGILANFRVLDELADLSLVRVADVGDGIVTVDLDLLQVSNRKFGWAPFWLALACISLSLLLRGIRQRFLAGQFGVAPDTPRQLSSFFFGRGLNVFFPYGPGDDGIVEAFRSSSVPRETALQVVFHNRAFELAGVAIVLGSALLWLGWEGALVPLVATIFLVWGLVAWCRPLGTRRSAASRGLRRIAHTFETEALASAWREMLQDPGFAVRVLLLSVVAVLLEILGYWFVKQAFSAPLQDYVLMKDLPLIQFALVIAVANITRILPFTFGSLGIYEIVSSCMFFVLGESFISGATVSILDGLAMNGVTLVLFVITLTVNRCPSILEVWRQFYSKSRTRQSMPPPETGAAG